MKQKQKLKQEKFTMPIRKYSTPEEALAMPVKKKEFLVGDRVRTVKVNYGVCIILLIAYIATIIYTLLSLIAWLITVNVVYPVASCGITLLL